MSAVYKRDNLASGFRVLFNCGLLTLLLVTMQVSLFAAGVLNLPLTVAASVALWIFGIHYLFKHFIPVGRSTGHSWLPPIDLAMQKEF